MSNVVVTGGYGLIGSHLVSALLDRGDSVTVFDFLPLARERRHRRRLTPLSIR